MQGMLTSKSKGFFIAAFVTILFTSAQAYTATINFDSLDSMNNAPGSIVPLANQLSNRYLTTFGVSFSSDANYVAVVDHDSPPGCGTPGTCPTVSEPNIIGGV
jgi:hypothetical protein